MAEHERGGSGEGVERVDDGERVEDDERVEGGATAPETVVCGTCGAMEVQALAATTWARGTERGRPVWTCLSCSRTHLRSIEGKLDSDWW